MTISVPGLLFSTAGNSISSSEATLHPLDDLAGVHGAGNAIAFLSVLEKYHGGDAHGPEMRGKALLHTDIDLAEAYVRGKQPGGLVKLRRHHATRAAGRGPEVHEHGETAAFDLSTERGSSYVDGFCCRDSGFAYATDRLIQPGRVNAVQGIA